MILLNPQLQAFLAVVKAKTVHGAAAAIYITQTAVTQRIRGLEERLATTLFIRTRRGMQLTSEGEALLRYCHAVQELEGQALASISGAGKNSTIQVSVTGPSSIMHSRIIPQYMKVMAKFPNLLLRFDVNDIENRLKSLRSGECEFAIIQQEDLMPEIQYKLLQPENYVLVCCKAWAKRSLKEIIREERIIDYDPSDQMTFNYLKHYKLYELARHDRHFVNRTDSLASMLLQGCGYSLLTTEFSQTYVNRGELIVLNAGKIYENKMALTWYERPEPPEYFKALIDSVD